MRSLFATTAVIAIASLALAGTPTLDGTIGAGEWPAAVATQDTNTGFGNNQNELNQMFVDGDATNLYIGLTGNLQGGGFDNAMIIWIDTTPGNNPALETISSDPMAGPCPGLVPTLLRAYSGTVMDPGFDPDYAMVISNGRFPGQSEAIEVLAVSLSKIDNAPLMAGDTVNVGIAIGEVDGVISPITSGTSGVQIAFDNSNTAGVGEWFTPGGETPADTFDDPTTATTGFEIAIPKSLLGISGSQSVSLFPFVSNTGADGGGSFCGNGGFAANQGLPGVAGFGNLATFNVTTVIDYTTVPNNQFVTVSVP